MWNGFKVIDSDAHHHEPMDMWDHYLEPDFRDRVPKVIGMRRNFYVYAHDDKLSPVLDAGSPIPAHHDKWMADKYGEAYDKWWSPEIRLADMDRYGWDIQVILSTSQKLTQPTLDSKIPRRSLGKRSNTPVKMKCAMVTMLSIGKPMIWSRALKGPSSPWSARKGAARTWRDSPCTEMGKSRSLASCHSASYSGSCNHFPAGSRGLRAETAPSFSTARRASETIAAVPRMDDHSHGRRLILGAGLPMKPSEYVLRQCVISADPDEPGLDTVIDFIGDDNLVWNTDYPHPDAPDPNQVLPWFSAQPISEDSKRKILWDNAVRLYGSRLLESAP
jgi:hypothetical protein